MTAEVGVQRVVDRSGCKQAVCYCHDDSSWREGSFPDGCSLCGCRWAEGQQPLLPTMDEIPVQEPTSIWEEKTALELVIETLHLPADTQLKDLPEYIRVKGEGFNDYGYGTYRIPLAPFRSFVEYGGDLTYQWPTRRVHFELDDPGSGDINWDNWEYDAREWANSIGAAAHEHVRECCREESVYPFEPSEMPDPEDYRDEDEDVREYCCQVVGQSGDEESVPHLDWALAMYMLIKSSESKFLQTANEQ